MPWVWNVILEPQITKFPLDTTVIEGEGVYFKIKHGEWRATANGDLVP